MSLPRRNDATLDGKYRLVSELATSHYAVVYEAEDLSVGKRVAVKVLRRNVDSAVRSTFFNAARAVARLSHPNLVSILAIGGSDEHAPYLVMEHLSGETLHDLVTREGPLPASKLAELALDLFAGLAALHAGGVLHGNLTPKNVFVTYPRPQRPLLKLLGLGMPSACREAALRETSYLSAPETDAAGELDSKQASERSDVYAASATLFFLATGRAPSSAIAPLTTPLPEAIRDCVALGLGSDPLAPPSSAADLVQHLSASGSRASVVGEARGSSLRAGFASLLQQRAPDAALLEVSPLGAPRPAASRPPKSALLRVPGSDRLLTDSLLVSPRVPKPPGSPKLELGLDFMPSPGDPVQQAELEQRRLSTQVPEKNRWLGALSATALGFTVGVALARLLGLI